MSFRISGFPVKFRAVKWDDVMGLQDIIAKLKAWSEHPTEILTLSGKPGRGKTMLACITAKEHCGVLLKSMEAWEVKTIDVMFSQEADIMYKFRSAMGSKANTDSLMRIYTEPDVLVLDDLGEAGDREFTRETISHIITTRHNRAKPTIITTNLTSNEVSERYGERIASRMLGGTAIGLRDDKYVDYRRKRGE